MHQQVMAEQFFFQVRHTVLLSDRFADHRGYVSRMEIDKAIGEHFNKARHKCSDMIPSIIEQVQPLGNNFLRMRREKYWINKYQAVDFGANRRF